MWQNRWRDTMRTSPSSTYLRSAGGILLAALAFELLLRHLSWNPPIAEGGRESTVVYRLLEGWGVSHWDARGIRLSRPEPPGPVVLTVGDSFTESAHVDDDEVYTSLVQSFLGLKVLNAGRSSLSPADYVLSAPRLLSEFRPAWTVIELNAPDLSGDGFIVTKAHFEIRDGHLVPVPAPVANLGRTSRILARLRPHSALLNYGIARGGMFRTLSNMPPLFRAADESQVAQGEPAKFTYPVEDELALMTSAFRHRTTFFFIPGINTGEDPIETRFWAYCASTGVSCVDFRAAFADFRLRGRSPFGFPNSQFGQGHLNSEGHRAAARLLARELLSLRRRGLF